MSLIYVYFNPLIPHRGKQYRYTDKHATALIVGEWFAYSPLTFDFIWLF